MSPITHPNRADNTRAVAELFCKLSRVLCKQVVADLLARRKPGLENYPAFLSGDVQAAKLAKAMAKLCKTRVLIELLRTHAPEEWRVMPELPRQPEREVSSVAFALTVAFFAENGSRDPEADARGELNKPMFVMAPLDKHLDRLEFDARFQEGCLDRLRALVARGRADDKIRAPWDAMASAEDKVALDAAIKAWNAMDYTWRYEALREVANVKEEHEQNVRTLMRNAELDTHVIEKAHAALEQAKADFIKAENKVNRCKTERENLAAMAECPFGPNRRAVRKARESLQKARANRKAICDAGKKAAAAVNAARKRRTRALKLLKRSQARLSKAQAACTSE